MDMILLYKQNAAKNQISREKIMMMNIILMINNKKNHNTSNLITINLIQI